MKNLKVLSTTISLLALIIFSLFTTSCENSQQLTTCDIDGPTSVVQGDAVTLTYSADVSISTVNWEVLSGNITIVNGQGTQTVTLSVNGTGQIRATGDGEEICSETITITATAPPCELHIADIKAELDWDNCFINIWDAAYPGNDDCGPYIYEWEVNDICQGNTRPFGNTSLTGFHAQFHNGTTPFKVYVTVTNSAGSQIAPWRMFNLSSSCNESCDN